MGLIKAAGAAIGSTLGDQWQDYITCNELSSENLIVKKTTETGQISNKSRILVGPGQAIIIVDNGRILDVSAEPGTYEFNSSSPTIFAGDFGASLKEVWERFKCNGEPSKQQEVYYVNIQGVIEGNTFGSPSPIVYDDPKYQTIYIRFHGSYTFRICNPLLFYNNVANDVANKGVYTKTDLMKQVDASFSEAITVAIGKCAYDEPINNRPPTFKTLTVKQKDITAHLNDELNEDWRNIRGIEAVEVDLKSVTPAEESRDQIQKYDDAYQFSDPTLMASRQGTAYANAMEGAANNANGAANGFMGLGMMNMGAGNMGANSLNFLAQNQQAQQAAPQPVAQSVEQPVQAVAATSSATKFCTNCGQAVTGKFCSNCGTAAPEDKPVVGCPKCGAIPPEGAKFCVECGSALN